MSNKKIEPETPSDDQKGAPSDQSAEGTPDDSPEAERKTNFRVSCY